MSAASNEAQHHLDEAVDLMRHILSAVTRDGATDEQRQNALASIHPQDIGGLCDSLRKAHAACNEARAERSQAEQAQR